MARGDLLAIHTILIFLNEIIFLIVTDKLAYFIPGQFYCHIGTHGTDYQTQRCIISYTELNVLILAGSVATVELWDKRVGKRNRVRACTAGFMSGQST